MIYFVPGIVTPLGFAAFSSRHFDSLCNVQA